MYGFDSVITPPVVVICVKSSFSKEWNIVVSFKEKKKEFLFLSKVLQFIKTNAVILCLTNNEIRKQQIKSNRKSRN